MKIDIIRVETTYNELRDYYDELVGRKLRETHELNEALANEGLGYVLSREQIEASIRVVKRHIGCLSDAMHVAEMLAATRTLLGSEDRFIAVFMRGGTRVEFAYIEVGGFRYSARSFDVDSLD